MLLFAIISITSAFIFYTLAVFIMRFSKVLSSWHLSLFCIGLFFDIIGTILMSTLTPSAFKSNLHSISGVVGIILMLFQTICGFFVIKSKKEARKNNFRKFGVIVWLIWLIPYLSGFVAHKV